MEVDCKWLLKIVIDKGIKNNGESVFIWDLWHPPTHVVARKQKSDAIQPTVSYTTLFGAGKIALSCARKKTTHFHKWSKIDFWSPHSGEFWGKRRVETQRPRTEAVCTNTRVNQRLTKIKTKSAKVASSNLSLCTCSFLKITLTWTQTGKLSSVWSEALGPLREMQRF